MVPFRSSIGQIGILVLAVGETPVGLKSGAYFAGFAAVRGAVVLEAVICSRCTPGDGVGRGRKHRKAGIGAEISFASAHISDYLYQFVAIDEGLGGRIARGTGEKASVHVVFSVSQIEIGG